MVKLSWLLADNCPSFVNTIFGFLPIDIEGQQPAGRNCLRADFISLRETKTTIWPVLRLYFCNLDVLDCHSKILTNLILYIKGNIRRKNILQIRVYLSSRDICPRGTTCSEDQAHQYKKNHIFFRHSLEPIE